MALTVPDASAALSPFRARAEALVDEHAVVTSNPYTRWFSKGEATLDEVRHLTVQFSVFSHLFVEAQLRKVINAPSIEAYHGGKEILLNELGVVFRPSHRHAELADGDVVATEGSVEGSRYFHRAAHFEWLLRFAAPLGLGFEQLGRRRHGTPSTLYFCDELLRVYGSDDPSTAEGASFAVERWAAAGFWKELIAGLERFRDRSGFALPLGFWTWHDKVEDQHAQHVEDELTEVYGEPWFDERRFLAGAHEMLDGVHAFWCGLEADRISGRAR
jgi:hypothetical protein